ncbi:Cupredoxin superfamily protein isoform 1 [Hibiscus syriacus]|uniref:Cupredoxin superfamily protein isoform 1 n=1 Tax=Hibiscus syriacus TaxID=106335 RepID=A0A6A2WRL7_HIBSY|nr:uncharacterized protein LOC120184600 [Hibiscus syriacus]KAE8663683.1 Cupredoxin superfamily protein isoform 1 [Hibiscus syriacus]
MALPTWKIVPTTNKIARELDEIYKDLHELDLAIDVPKILVKKYSLQKEKHIPVDPISLRESSMGEISFNMMLAPQADTEIPLPPPLLPAKHKFLSYSPPNSATSSPRFGLILSRKILKAEIQTSPPQVDKLVKKHPSLKSKSCGDGRTCAPPDEVDDLWMYEKNAFHYNKHYRHGSLISNPNVINNGDEMDGNEVDFKCNALCLFLPGFTKAKQVKPRKEAMAMENYNAISRTVSLEKFECGSWASSTIIPDRDVDDGDSMNTYFDLPLELIKSLGNDSDLPVSSAFVFDNKDVKGVLKNGSSQTRSTGRKSHESSSSRHVRFTASSPTSYPASPASRITPRLRKARDDFNAFLEAPTQTA